MKMLVITSIKEDVDVVNTFFEKAAVAVFSVSDTIGHKNEQSDYLLHNWFGKKDTATNALFFFSFTEDDKAYQAVELVKSYNLEQQPSFPIRAFVLPVDYSSYE